jgi:ketosteroid isomerase-like protein
VAAAWIGFAGGVFAAVLSAWVALRQRKLERAEQAEVVLKRYREPLAAAAFDLQSRLYNILCQEFFETFGKARGEEVFSTTLFRIAQYFGWTEILRRDIQFLSFPEDKDTKKVADLQREIARAFLEDEPSHALMIWSDEQRALGELMIVEEHDKVLCMGYARFRKDEDGVFAPWRERLDAELLQPDARERMRKVQHLLCKLVRTLDPGELRYAKKELRRAQQNVVVAHRWVELFNERDDVEEFLSLHDPEVVLQTPGGPRLRGHDEVRAWFEKGYENAQPRILPERFVEGHNTVVGLGRTEVRWIESGEVANEFESAGAYWFRDGKIIKWQPFETHAAALKETGLGR